MSMTPLLLHQISQVSALGSEYLRVQVFRIGAHCYSGVRRLFEGGALSRAALIRVTKVV